MKNPLFIIDLDNTLICSEPMKEYYNGKGDFHLTFPGEKWQVYMRPGVNELFAYFHDNDIPYMIWSAGVPEYVNQIVDNLKNQVPNFYPITVWSRDQCDVIVDGYDDFCKNFWVFWDINPDYNWENTFMIDDKSVVARYNQENLMRVSPFDPNSNECDVELFELVEHLQKQYDSTTNLPLKGTAVEICDSWMKNRYMC